MKKLNLFFLIIIGALSCTDKNSLFEELSPFRTGIKFSNDLAYDETFNIFTYRNYYNGGGVGLGDINNDGLIDVYFTGNIVDNKLFLNKGNFKFRR